MCGGLFGGGFEPPDVQPYVPPPPVKEPEIPDPVFQPGSEKDVAAQEVAPTKKGKNALKSEGVGLSIPTEG